MTSLPEELVAFHAAGKPLYCDIPIQPWTCESWPLDRVLKYNDDYMVPVFAPGYLGFATSGSGEMYALDPSGRIVCLAFVGMSPKEELAVAETWREFEIMLSRSETA